MVRLISRQRGGLAALKLTKLFGIDDFPAAKDSGKVLIIIIYCYVIIVLLLLFQPAWLNDLKDRKHFSFLWVSGFFRLWKKKSKTPQKFS